MRRFLKMHKQTTKKVRRNVNGILLLDKPYGITSNEALQIVKRDYNATKAGHSGSLDPIATGMLPICFGEATKFSQFLLESDKSYFVVAQLGITTASGDTEGEIIAKRDASGVVGHQVEKIISQFKGKISQIPSMYSAIKHKGEPLYKLARQGIEIERQPREITIHQLDFLKLEQDLLYLSVHCSKGTYVRTLVADIGEALGCGAHVVELRRLTVGPFQEEQMISMDTIHALANNGELAVLDSFLLPVEAMLIGWSGLQLSEDMAYYVRQGNPIVVPAAPTSGWVKLYNKSDKFLGVGEILPDGKVAPRRLIQSS
jgi:tRNA pseudouridine55 synthase